MHARTLLVAALSAFLGTAAAAAEEAKLNVYNWSDYIAPDTIPAFEKRTGMAVTYDVYDSNEVLEGKLLTGRTGYDLVVPSSNFFERLIQAGVFRKLDRAKLKNWDNLDPAIMALLAQKDPGNQYGIPYMWGTTGIGFDVAKVKERLGAETLDSWDAVFRPENAAKLKDCGISLLNAPSEIIQIALHYLGHDPFTQDDALLKQAEDMLLAVRPYIKYFHSSQYIDDLANGEICVAVGYSGDIYQAIEQAPEERQLAYAIPKEGTIVWFDVMALPADAPHPENAHTFIDYLLEPEVIAAVSNEVFYANPNAKAFDLVDEKIRTDPSIYPSPEVRARLFTDKAVDQALTRKRTRLWTRVTTGQ